VSELLLLLGFLALLVWWLLRKRADVLPGEVVYRDTPDAPTLVSRRFRLAGRPDYVTRESRGLVPVEVKSRTCGEYGPYAGERAQLFAYCLIVEEEFSGTVARGELQYRDRKVTVPFGEPQRQEIINLLKRMDAMQEAHRSHSQAGRCRRCGFRDQCSEALA
jgi:CRISPR-associated exonuclease Cas4